MRGSRLLISLGAVVVTTASTSRSLQDYENVTERYNPCRISAHRL